MVKFFMCIMYWGLSTIIVYGQAYDRERLKNNKIDQINVYHESSIGNKYLAEIGFVNDSGLVEFELSFFRDSTGTIDTIGKYYHFYSLDNQKIKDSSILKDSIVIVSLFERMGQKKTRMIQKNHIALIKKSNNGRVYRSREYMDDKCIFKHFSRMVGNVAISKSYKFKNGRWESFIWVRTHYYYKNGQKEKAIHDNRRTTQTTYYTYDNLGFLVHEISYGSLYKVLGMKKREYKKEAPNRTVNQTHYEYISAP